MTSLGSAQSALEAPKTDFTRYIEEHLPSEYACSLIQSDTELALACKRWVKARVIGIDTEFVRERTYHPQPGLVQVADSVGSCLIDPLAISDFDPFKELVASNAIVKLMHASDEDIDVLEILTGVTPQNIYDIQLAGAFAGYGFALSYQNLVSLLFGVALEKEQTRSDWLKRPLSQEQLRYAELDVTYLLPAYETLTKELQTRKRTQWFEEELQLRDQARKTSKQTTNAYLKIGRRGSLSPMNHAVLRALSQWREHQAIARNMPRRHLLSDEVLVELASEAPLTPLSLSSIKGISRNAFNRYEQQLLSCINQAVTEGPSADDSLVNLNPYKSTIRRLQEHVKKKAASYGLPPELIATRRSIKRLLTKVIRTDGDVPLEFQGWRFNVVTTTLLDCIRNKH